MTDSTGPGPRRPGRSSACDALEQDLVLYLYDELAPSATEAVERHLGACARCREALDSFRETLDTIDGADLVAVSTQDRPGDWGAIEAALLSAGLPPARRVFPSVAFLARAAAILLVAGASFAGGLHWDGLRRSLGAVFPGDDPAGTHAAGSARDPGIRPRAVDGQTALQVFSRETNGYLDRSRLVLLEFANADEALASPVLRQATEGLLREQTMALRVAGEIADSRIQETVSDLGAVLREISALAGPADAQTVQRIRTHLDDSGLLDRLEIMSSKAQQIAAHRPRT